VKTLPIIGELMLASFESVPDKIDFSAWYFIFIFLFILNIFYVLCFILIDVFFLNFIRWMSEKYDGVRALWHFADRKLYPALFRSLSLALSLSRSLYLSLSPSLFRPLYYFLVIRLSLPLPP
jgi:hypothetical protein